MKEISLQELLKAGVHFGHQTSKWHPKMKSYIFGSRDKVHIIDLQKTLDKLKEALEFIADLAKKGGIILFIATKKQAKDIVVKAAQNCGMPYIVERWLGGTFTNFKTIHNLIKKLRNFEKDDESGEFDKYTKKEKLLKKAETERLQKIIGGIKNLDKLPDAVFIIDIARENIALKEAKKNKIPIVALVDTNANPELVDYPIPSNDDAIKAIELMSNLIAETIKENYKVVATPKKEEKEKILKPKKKKNVR